MDLNSIGTLIPGADTALATPQGPVPPGMTPATFVATPATPLVAAGAPILSPTDPGAAAAIASAANVATLGGISPVNAPTATAAMSPQATAAMTPPETAATIPPETAATTPAASREIASGMSTATTVGVAPTATAGTASVMASARIVARDPRAPDPRVDAFPRAASATSVDVYHGSTVSLSPTLLTQKGVGAYVQLLNALAGNELHEKSADSLTARLQNASSALKVAYAQAASDLPPHLAAKDWGFSVSNGKVIFIAHQDVLSEQDLIALHDLFTRPNVESAAKQVAAVITTIVQMRKAGADTGALAWARFNVADDNFADIVDLRTYATATAPGSHYHPNTPAPVSHSQIPASLGGMDLRNLVTARPTFLRPDGSVSPEGAAELQAPPLTARIGLLHGQCSCGQVQFIVQDEFEYAFYCHCSRCRARTGSAFAAIAGIAIDGLEVTAGHEHLSFEGECSDGYGARCTRCFSFLFSAVRGRQYLHVSLGVVAGTPSRVPDHHIYVGSKAPWYQITDALPQYVETP